MTISTTIFETPGPHNTQRTVELAVAAARELGIKTVLAASCTGFVADTLLQQDLTGLSPVIVSHAYGFLADGENELPSDKRRHYESLGVPVCTAAHPLSGAERSLSNAFGGAYPVEVMAHTLRLFGQGTKVCVEACAIAADAGVIVPGQSIVAIGGTGHGADTALVLRPAHTNRLLRTRLDYFICKPLRPLED